MQYVYLVIVFFGTWFLNFRAVYLFICTSISLLLTARKFQSPMHICAKTRTYLRRCTHTIFGNLRKTSFCKIWKQLFSKLLWCPWTPQWLHDKIYVNNQLQVYVLLGRRSHKQGRRQLTFTSTRDRQKPTWQKTNELKVNRWFANISAMRLNKSS